MPARRLTALLAASLAAAPVTAITTVTAQPAPGAAAAPAARAVAELELADLGAAARRSLSRAGGDVDARAHQLAVARDVERWQERREAPRPSPTLTPPPGDPFGEDW